jgi:hypothetical protein
MKFLVSVFVTALCGAAAAAAKMFATGISIANKVKKSVQIPCRR